MHPSRCREAPAVFRRLLFTKTYKTMKEFIDIWAKPFQKCGLTRREMVIMAVAVPAAYVAVCILANVLP